MGMKALVYGADNTLSWWGDIHGDANYFSVWYGKQMLFSFNQDDETAASDFLSSVLKNGEKVGSMDVYILKIHSALDSNGQISDKTPYSNSIPFCCGQRPGDAMNGLPITTSNEYNARYKEGMNYKLDQIAETLQTKFTAIESRLTALEETELPGEDEDENILSGFLKDPQVKGLIVSGITGLLTGRGMQQPQAMAGLPNDAAVNDGEQRTIFNQAVAVLWQHDKQLGSDLMKLAKVAQTSKEGFEQILSYIRSLNV